MPVGIVVRLLCFAALDGPCGSRLGCCDFSAVLLAVRTGGKCQGPVKHSRGWGPALKNKWLWRCTSEQHCMQSVHQVDYLLLCCHVLGAGSYCALQAEVALARSSDMLRWMNGLRLHCSSAVLAAKEDWWPVHDFVSLHELEDMLLG